ncbi:hypothetical protein AMTR_s00026p00135910 [Amborella trichopoda]|uniref:Malectin-like domain-containing protein n=1 Tax=Amborella trichopoda TaxID=13333 RepID=W1PRD1_AMBTC|nr:hypothetical protein AMTR_s00026p00135910 [Amborella trichopoda]
MAEALFVCVCILSAARALVPLPCEGELGTNSYTDVSFIRQTSLGFIKPTQEIEWHLSITFVGKYAQLCRYEDASGEPLIQRDGVPLYHALHRSFYSSRDLPTLRKRMLMRMNFHWATGALRFEGEHQ